MVGARCWWRGWGARVEWGRSVVWGDGKFWRRCGDGCAVMTMLIVDCAFKKGYLLYYTCFTTVINFKQLFLRGPLLAFPTPIVAEKIAPPPVWGLELAGSQP